MRTRYSFLRADLFGQEWVLAIEAEDWEPVDSKKIKKHRRDVFALAATLPNEPGPRLSDPILTDLRRFHDSFPATHRDWGAILDSIADDIGGRPPPDGLLGAIARYFVFP